jgi:hypothetical protein
MDRIPYRPQKENSMKTFIRILIYGSTSEAYRLQIEEMRILNQVKA